MAPVTKVGIISIGEMGVGIAKLLSAHGYSVLTNITGRSEYTHRRAATASITVLGSDAELATQADYILSIVPPRDALATAKRFTNVDLGDRATPLYYLDLNAVSPGLVRTIRDELTQNAPTVKFVDGGIIGGPPSIIDQAKDSQVSESTEPGTNWKRPSIPLSGPHPLPSDHSAKVLNTTYLGPGVGSASGLKCCFASLTKGLTALAIQSFTTAESLGIYSELQRHLELFNPALQKSTTNSVPGIPPKSGRWVEEMREIGRCFGEDGGWDNVKGDEGANIYKHVAEVYKTIADDTVLGKERQEHRERGTTANDVAVVLAEALNSKKTSMMLKRRQFILYMRFHSRAIFQ